MAEIFRQGVSQNIFEGTVRLAGMIILSPTRGLTNSGEFPVRLRSEKNVTGAWPGGIVFPPDIPVAAPQAVIDLKYWGEQAHQESLMGKPAW